jgi:hypothetical protein
MVEPKEGFNFTPASTLKIFKLASALEKGRKICRIQVKSKGGA